MEKRLYPSSSFWNTYFYRENVIRDAAKIVTLPGDDKPVLALNIRNHPIIECGDVDGAVLGSWVNINDCTKEFSGSNISDGYWACAAVWSDAWGPRTVDRVSHDCRFNLLIGYLHLIYDIRTMCCSSSKKFVEKNQVSKLRVLVTQFDFCIF